MTRDADLLTPSLAALRAGAAEVVLIRHGQALGVGTLAGVGYREQPLTPTGREQADAAARWVVAVGPVDAVHVSPLLRCRQTAEPLLALVGRDPVLDDRLVELRTPMDDLSVGGTPEETEAALREQAMALASAVGPDGRLLDVDGVEPRAPFRARVGGVLRELAVAHEGERVVVVSHGLWCGTAVSMVAGAVPDLAVLHHHAGVSTLRVTPVGEAMLTTANSVAHLLAAGLPLTLI